ncbi:MAG: hypothetical protein RJA22_1199 [Verrucomicrobiota bacterium]|jgi:DNA-binding NtrC family response regulator
MPIEKIIILEDDLVVRKTLEQQLRYRRYDVASSGTIAGALELLGKDNFDLMIVDVKLPDGDGIELLKQLNARPSRPLVVMISSHGTVDMAVECMSNGAFTFLTKPISSEHLAVTLKKADEHSQLVRVSQHLSQGDDDECEIIGVSPAMEALRDLIRKVGRTQATVLIQGESGTGKELVARALYRQSPRATAPFIKINCAAVPESLIESEFFGHEKGAFTNAMTKREGRFELAHGGTLLLDEVSEVAPKLQAKLLRVLQEREFERVGGNRTIKVDVRVIATTNRTLEQSVERQEFRQDLFYRLNVVPIIVPALREHREDIPVLAEQFCRRFARKHGSNVRGLSPAAVQALTAHSWPGNVRELQNVLERAVILSGDSTLLEPEHFGLGRDTLGGAHPGAHPGAHAGLSPSAATPAAAAAAARPAAATPAGDALTLAEVEKQHILAAIEKFGNNRTHAARALDISVRTLRNKLTEYGWKDAEVNESMG